MSFRTTPLSELQTVRAAILELWRFKKYFTKPQGFLIDASQVNVEEWSGNLSQGHALEPYDIQLIFIVSFLYALWLTYVSTE